MLLAALSFIPSLVHPAYSVIGLAVTGVVLDFCVQMNMVLGQRAVYALDAHSRSRLNALYMTSIFIGGALGSSIASAVYEHGGWLGVVAVGSAFPLLALLRFLQVRDNRARPGARRREPLPKRMPLPGLGRAGSTKAGASDAFAYQYFDIGRRSPESQAADQASIGFTHQVEGVDGLGRGPFDELAAVEVGQGGQLEFIFIKTRGDRYRSVLGTGRADEVATQVHHAPTGNPPVAQGFVQPGPGTTGKAQAIDDHAAVDDQPQLAITDCP